MLLDVRVALISVRPGVQTRRYLTEFLWLTIEQYESEFLSRTSLTPFGIFCILILFALTSLLVDCTLSDLFLLVTLLNNNMSSRERDTYKEARLRRFFFCRSATVSLTFVRLFHLVLIYAGKLLDNNNNNEFVRDVLKSLYLPSLSNIPSNQMSSVCMSIPLRV